MASDSLKLYGAIYVALISLAASKWLFFHIPSFSYWDAFAAVMVAAAIKTLLIVGYFQHLRWENRSLTGLMGVALSLTLLLMAAASFSIV
ncbi:MAG: cytochrome C oxidase subunit IV family protein [Natronomonas sp.]